MATTATTTARLPSYNECRYTSFDPATSCRTDRNCADCLETQGCRISTGGFCEPDASPNADNLNYARGRVVGNVSRLTDTSVDANATQMWHFPASQATYCGGDDSVCNRCTEENYGVASGSDTAEDSRFCVSASGCVCVQNCRSSFFEMAYCDSPESSAVGESSNNADVATPESASVAPVSAPVSAPVPAQATAETESHSVSVVVWIVIAVTLVLVGLLLRVLRRRLQARRTLRHQEGHCELLDDPTMKASPRP